jgi:hypothetical protein
MSIEISDERLLNQCIRCKQGNTEFNTINRRYSLGSRTKKSYKIHLSVCNDCIDKIYGFLRYEQFYNKYNKYLVNIILRGYWLIAVICFIYGLFTYDYIPLLISLGIFPCFAIILILIRYRYFNHPEHLKRYLDVRSDGELIIKDPNYSISDQVVNVVANVDEEIREKHKFAHKFCPNCGANNDASIGFCNKCGKRLI